MSAGLDPMRTKPSARESRPTAASVLQSAILPNLKRDVHVWYFAIGSSDTSGDLPVHELSPPERDQARRFRAKRDRDRYVVAHVTMRRILAAYAGNGRRHVDIVEGIFGK